MDAISYCPMLEVSTKNALLPEALTPRISVITPSSNRFRKGSHTAGLAFSISSSSTTE